MSDRMVEDVIEDVLATLFKGNDVLYEVAKELEYELKDKRSEIADAFYSIAESELKAADDDAYRDGRKLTIESRYYEGVIKAVTNVMTALIVVTVRDIGDMVDSRDYADLQDIYDRVFGRDRNRGRDRDRDRDRGGRDRDRDRSSRGRDRDRDRGGRDRGSRSERRDARGRDEGAAQAAYGRGGRDRDREERGGRRDREERRDRTDREERVPYEKSRRERTDGDERSNGGRPGREQNVGEGEVLVNHGQVLNVGKIALPLPSNSVIGYDGARKTGWVINPLTHRIRAVLSEDNRVVAQVFMEPYEKHELGYAYGIVTSDDKVMPIVDFTTVPDFVDPVAVDNSPRWTVEKDVIYAYDQALNPNLVIQKADNLLNHKRDIGNVTFIDQEGKYSLPLALKVELEENGISLIPDTFDGWASFQAGLKVYLLNMNNDAEDRLRAQQAYTAIDGVLCRMLRDMLRINHSGWLATGEFCEDWPDVRKLLEGADHTDDLTLFTRDEANFIKGYISSKYELTDDNRWEMEVHARYLVLSCTDYFLGANVLPTRINRYCEVEQEYTPEFYSAMNRLMRLRNNRYGLTPVLIGDANRQAVRMVSGPLDGAKIWMLLGL